MFPKYVSKFVCNWQWVWWHIFPMSLIKKPSIINGQITSSHAYAPLFVQPNLCLCDFWGSQHLHSKCPCWNLPLFVVFTVIEPTGLIITSQLEPEYYVFTLENSVKVVSWERSNLMNLWIFLGNVERQMNKGPESSYCYLQVEEG